MPRLILIETSTALCSTALAEDGEIVAYRESTTPRSHASLTALFIQEMLEERGIRAAACDAVCVSMGPGSYTGLRVGVSSAKGLCFGAGLPLIGIGTLDVLAAQAQRDGVIPEGCRYIVPLIDARRMEVYAAVFTPDGRQLTPTAPAVIDGGSFRAQLAEGPVLFIGDGAVKCRAVLSAPTAHFQPGCPRADAMLAPALRAFEAGEFRDTAYFEPFYLKQFVATVSAKKLF